MEGGHIDGLLHQQVRNAIDNRISEALGLADQKATRRVVLKGPAALWADQDVKKFGVHAAS